MIDKISVVVPIYKVERFLPQCLDSIVGQTYRNLEIILIDDGSPDNCGAICEEYAGRDSRVIVVHQENQGVSVARNVGIERASGEWIMFVDPDDWLELDCCERALEIAQKEPWDVVCFQRQNHDESGKTIKAFPSVGSYQIDRERIRRAQLNGLQGTAGNENNQFGFDYFACWGKLYRRSFLISNGLRFVEGLKKEQDIIFNIYCSVYIQRVYFLDYVGYHYRQNSFSICHRRNMEMLEIKLTCLREIERFAIQYDQEDPRYEKLVGTYAYMIPSSLKKTMLFHPDGRMPYSEFRETMNRYYNDEIVMKYMGKCSIKDFTTMKNKIRYLLLSGRHLWAFYWISFMQEYWRRSHAPR